MPEKIALLGINPTELRRFLLNVVLDGLCYKKLIIKHYCDGGKLIGAGGGGFFLMVVKNKKNF